MSFLWFKTKEEKRIEKDKEKIHKDVEMLMVTCDRMIGDIEKKISISRNKGVTSRFEAILKRINGIKYNLSEAHIFLKEINKSNIPSIIDQLSQAEKEADGLMNLVSDDNKSDMIYIRSNITRLKRNLPSFKFE